MEPAAKHSDVFSPESVPKSRRRGVTVVPHRQERRVYFLATLALTAWYLIDRLL